MNFGRTQLHCHELLRSFAVFAECVVELVCSPLQAVAAVGVCPLGGVEVLLVFGRVLLSLFNLQTHSSQLEGKLTGAADQRCAPLP